MTNYHTIIIINFKRSYILFILYGISCLFFKGRRTQYCFLLIITLFYLKGKMVVNVLLWGYLKGQNEPIHKEKSKLAIPPNLLSTFSEVTVCFIILRNC